MYLSRYVCYQDFVRKYWTFIACSCFFIFSAPFSYGDFTVESLAQLTSESLNDAELFQAAQRFLICGTRIPTATYPADIIQSFVYATSTENEVNPPTALRLDEVIRLYRLNLGRKIIVNGTGLPGNYLAENARDYLIQRGVLASDIIIEPHSKNTYDEVVNAFDIMFKEKYNSVIFVSSPEHMDRILRYYEKISKTDPYLKRATEIGLYWSSYSYDRDDLTSCDFRNRVHHEIFTILKDHFQLGNPLRSKSCKAAVGLEFIENLKNLMPMSP
jgi:uncharacterized SAM-binding protein YcdF (DUF218 family)